MRLDADHLHRLAGHLADPGVAWSLGSFGVIAEFMWSDGEPIRAPSALSRITPRGAILVAPPPAAVWLAYTTPSRQESRQRDDVALCLPVERCTMAARTVVTELGPDAAALREADREAILFDVGLGQRQVDAMVRTADPATLELLRGACGRPLLEQPEVAQAIPRLSPHRVFASACGRIEVYGPIPPPDGRSPDGPHTHVLPKLMRHGRTHAANLPIPNRLVPCLTIHLSRPAADHAIIAEREGDVPCA